MSSNKTDKEESDNNNLKKNGINEVRVHWCFAYLFLGFILLALLYLSKCLTLQELLILKLPLILWSASWASIGIGLCLWNSRTNKEKVTNAHYATYFLFILFFATIAAVAFSQSDKEIQLYLQALAIALGIGFTGERLQAKI